ncbi:hypothetical protein ACQCU1_21525 [Sutcliffiella horikoshii]|uniref:Uncharacterized protein n=2 Tax=Sutcliffiella horikoshii TaxID=79883 RepID=A0A1Y0CMX1_9BACI|nr:MULTISPECIES: hypothetical protein [Bacillaceae]ART76599.1 hypothetical protein B4U37_11360 [Sutcliffiella horikoshii]TYS57959.1 hypothetical protein FZC74_13245 [Sutcliffiella horikoshii]TYS62573.1 hypothetical protein FZC76_20265 [Sutcliffiella horikoshii]TYS73099.1 hypothetical protein FZC75_08585 [Sutcliffiella horikoshii]
MADSKDMQREISKLTQATTNMMLQNVLKKHNVKLSGDNFSKEQKAQLKKLVADIQDSFGKMEKLQKEEKK